MNYETKLVEMMIVVFILCIIIMPFLCIKLLIENISKAKYIENIQIRINDLQFEKEYLEFVLEDSIKQ
jgi:hypothetical protein